MVVGSHILEAHRAANSSVDWSSGGAQFYSPTLHAFLYGLYNNADKDDVIPMADHVHKRVCYQLSLSEKLLMPNTCVPPIHTTALEQSAIFCRWACAPCKDIFVCPKQSQK
eukprot:6190332-Pleurochrysis_carterae.AAC.1